MATVPKSSPYYYGGSVAPVTNVKVAAGKTPAKAVVAKAKAKPLTVREQAIQQVQAVNAASATTANTAAKQAIQDAKQQAQQALGFQTALDNITQGDSGRIFDAYGNAANKMSAYGDLALASAGDSSRSAAEQAQNYLASVGPDVGAETRPDIAGALRALAATGVGDPSGELRAQGAYAQERSRNIRNAQLMRLADIGANATYQGVQTANKLRADEVARAAGSREADVNAAMAAIREEGRAAHTETRAQKAEKRAEGEYARAGTLATNTEKRAAAAEGRAKTAETRAADDQRMKDLAFDIALQQQQVDLASTKLANATGEIAKQKAQFELDNAQTVLDASLKQQAAETAGQTATTAATRAGIDLTKAQTEAQKLETTITKKKGGKTLTPYEESQITQAAHDEAKEMFAPPPPTQRFGKQAPTTPYPDALNRIMGKYGLSKQEATDVLNVYYKVPGEHGRPVFDLGEQEQLIKLGFTKAQINQASNGYGKKKRTHVNNPGYDLWEKMADRLAGRPSPPATRSGPVGSVGTPTRTAAGTYVPSGPTGPTG